MNYSSKYFIERIAKVLHCVYLVIVIFLLTIQLSNLSIFISTIFFLLPFLQLIQQRLLQKKMNSDLLSIVFGIVVPCGAILDVRLLPLMCIGYLIFSDKDYFGSWGCKKKLVNIWMAPFLFVVILWTGIHIFWSSDIQTILSYFTDFKAEHFSKAILLLRNNSFELETILLAPLSYVFCFHLIDLFIRKENKLKFVFFGIKLGLFLTLLIGLAQVLRNDLFVYQHMNAFWKSLYRIPAGFTDPNSCGIFLALVLPWLFFDLNTKTIRFKPYETLLIIGTLVLGLYSGSRSFILAIVIYFGFVCWKKSKLLLVSIAIVLILGIVFLILNEPINLSPGVPSAIRRLVDTFSFGSVNDSFFSRIAFTKISLAMWFDNPILGVGFNSYRDYVTQYSHSLNLGLGVWSDNANNFYLSILAELGLFGFIGLIFSLKCFKLKKDFRVTQQGLLLPIYTLVILLLLGPHLDFIEVAILFSILFSFNFSVEEKPNHSNTLIFCIFVGAFIFWKSYYLETGLYQYEKSNNRLFQWTRQFSRIYVYCDSSKSNFMIRAAHPNMNKDAVIVKLENETGSSKEYIFTDSLLREVSFKCDKESDGGMWINIFVNRSWVPGFSFDSNDFRILGVQLYRKYGKNI